ncbi:MAG: ATP-binding protein [Clostridia bacterium]|nr:ATP-binding protein [Clostridia bacterium]
MEKSYFSLNSKISKKLIQYILHFWRIIEATSVKIPFIYALVGTLWILVSDRLVLLFFHNPLIITQISIYKGWAFVLSTALLLFILIQKDMQAIHHAQKELQRQQTELQVILDTVPAMIFYKDSQCRVVRINKTLENVMKLSGSEIIGKSMFEFLKKEDAEKFEADDWEILRTGLPKLNIIETVTTPTGIRWFKTDKVPYKDETGKTVGIIGFGSDITERIAAEEEVFKLNKELEKRVIERTSQLEEANRELESFSFSVSHDLKAPLRAIEGFSRILAEEQAGVLNDECNRLIGIIRKNTALMSQLIDDLLAFSRISKTQLTKVEIDMKTLIHRVFDELKSHHSERNIQFHLRSVHPLFGDVSMVRQMISNLLSNAIKFTGNRDIALIEVGCQHNENELIYYIRDNGVGFDMKYAGKLFGVFQRMHTEDEFEGHGIGLSIVQRIIHKHGGKVWIEGILNQGTTVYFTIPD